ncbi:class I SAM-dependent methyltransferase [Candidatus Methylospira mobilis]|uniref:class I SAM-dependent methyltransferase n=1 Tax=Candidatus Methylospira mobilis TaxID=1808979 RepID=UPI0028EA056F|nr:class I SAM-dependent methyltransferase [Candidatus Methylospira mobilis]WNV06081.1 class I SAM-dependent methyltransferase [Candidatus Methylospira mobilis]
MNQNNVLDSAAFSPRFLQLPGGCGHLAFSSWIIQEISPQVFVQLGVDKGNAYFSFCQAVAEAGLSTKCYAIDAWSGDEQTALYANDFFSTVKTHNEQYYGGFSLLLRVKYDEAVDSFDDESVGLLHIDGAQSYDEVRRAFDVWLPKLISDAVVTLGNINMQKSGSAWKFWEELKARYPHNMEFIHSNGLGVAQISKEAHDNVLEWIRFDSPCKEQLINYFSTLDKRYLELTETRRHFDNLNRVIAQRDEQIVSLNRLAMEQLSKGEIERRKLEVDGYKAEFKLSCRLREKEHELEAKEHELKVIDEHWKKSEALRYESEVRCQVLAQELEAFRVQVELLNGVIQEKERYAESLLRENEVIMTSFSMRITKPLRGMLNIVRRIKRR